jgi:hypothetical protein
MIIDRPSLHWLADRTFTPVRGFGGFTEILQVPLTLKTEARGKERGVVI